MRFLNPAAARVSGSVTATCALFVACNSDPPGKSGADQGGGTGAAGGVTSGSGGSSVAGAGTGAGGSAGSSTAGAGGSSASGGSAGATAGVGGNAGRAGAGGGSGNGGSGGGSGLKGGASGAFVCAPGASYGNPLTGMGAVVTINPPTTGGITYFAFIEGPVWVASRGRLYFSDNAASPEERIWMLTPPSTTPEVFMENSGSNGLAIDADDKLILADQRRRRITRVDPALTPAATVVVPAGNFTPNDLVVRSDGNIYFTDPNSSGRGFYRVSPTGQITGPMQQVNNPNGIVLSPDENTLYVGDVQNRTITSFSLLADGSVNTGSAGNFATTVGSTTDGMAVDCAGNVYAGTQSGVEVFSAARAIVGTVPTGESSNATFGGTDRRTLYVTSRSVLKAVTLAVPGLPD